MERRKRAVRKIGHGAAVRAGGVFRLAVIAVMVVLCMGALSPVTWGFFTDAVTVQANSIQSAAFDVTAKVDMQEVASHTDYTCGLVEKDHHSITLTPTGTATRGFCRVVITDPSGEEREYIATGLVPGQDFAFTLEAAKDCRVEFFPEWGEPQGHVAELIRIEKGGTITHSNTKNVPYTVQDGMTPETLAEFYEVPVDDILTYNGITELPETGEILIPGTDVNDTPEVSSQEEEGEEGGEQAGGEQAEEEQGETNPILMAVPHPAGALQAMATATPAVTATPTPAPAVESTATAAAAPAPTVEPEPTPAAEPAKTEAPEPAPTEELKQIEETESIPEETENE